MECAPFFQAAYTQLVDPLSAFFKPALGQPKGPGTPPFSLGVGHLNPEEDDKRTDLGEPIFGQSHGKTGGVT